MSRAWRSAWLWWVLAHGALGTLIKTNSGLATVHAWGTLLCGLWLCLGRENSNRMLCWIAYVIGVDVLWRMGRADVPWEFSKYAISLTVIVHLLRIGIRQQVWLPTAYFVLLVPAIGWTLQVFPLDMARKEISFNLSGPLCLALCGVFFKQVEIPEFVLRRMLWQLVTALTSVASAVLSNVAKMSADDFGSEANVVASGGFGPNQVSGAFGGGALFALFLMTAQKTTVLQRCILGGLGVWFLAHAALSFSRTGIYLFALGVVCALPFMDLRTLLRPAALIFVLVATIGGGIVWGRLDRFTDGHLGARFGKTQLTGRDRVAHEDLDVWRENPVFGVGVGVARLYRERNLASHTEYTRLLAEHGLAGLAAIACVVLMGLSAVARGHLRSTRAVLVACGVVGVLTLSVSGMRMATPAVLIALGGSRPSSGTGRSGNVQMPIMRG